MQERFDFAAVGDDVGGLENAGDNDNVARPSGEDGSQVLAFDPANAIDRQSDRLLHAPDFPKPSADRGLILRRRGKDGAKAEVIGRFCGCGHGLGKTGGGFANELTRPQQAARFGHGKIALPDMDAVKPEFRRKLRVVIEEKRDSRRRAKRLQ